MLHLVHVSILRGAAMDQRMLTLAWEGVWGGGKTHWGRRARGMPPGYGRTLTTSGISGNEAIVRYGGSCRAAAGPSCSQVTVAGCGPACPV